MTDSVVVLTWEHQNGYETIVCEDWNAADLETLRLARVKWPCKTPHDCPTHPELLRAMVAFDAQGVRDWWSRETGDVEFLIADDTSVRQDSDAELSAIEQERDDAEYSRSRGEFIRESGRDWIVLCLHCAKGLGEQGETKRNDTCQYPPGSLGFKVSGGGPEAFDCDCCGGTIEVVWPEEPPESARTISLDRAREEYKARRDS